MATYEEADRDVGIILQKAVTLVNGANELVALVASQQIQLLKLSVGVDAAMLLQLKSGTDVITTWNLTANGVVNEHSDNPERPIYCSNVGGNLSLDCGAAPTTTVAYIQYRMR
jgi:hypothetical protein